MTVAIVAMVTSGIVAQSGAILKNGLSIQSGCDRIMAPWPR